MASGSISLSTQYKQVLRNLNPLLPAVIEHLVTANILTRTEASRVVSTSDQFNRLCEQLASKGYEKRAEIFSEIESFRGSREQQTAAGRLGATTVQLHHKHMLSGAEGGRKQGGEMAGSGWKGRKRQSSEPAGAMEMNGCGIGAELLHKALEMEPFIVQFCVFVHQLLLSNVGRSSKGSHDQSHDASPSLPVPTWFQLDLTRDQVLAFFPSQLRKSIKSCGSSDKFELVSLSGLLGQFKNYVKKCEGIAQENKQLKSKGKLLQSLTERNAHLEDEVWEVRKAADSHRPVGSQHAVSREPWSDRGEREAVSQMKRALKKSESRVKELVGINEQWALESQERASEIKVLQIQLGDAREEIQSVRSKLSRSGEVKMKPQESECRSGEGEGEGRRRRESKLQKERDAALQENARLKAELEEERQQREKDRDEIAELRDRAGNLRIQAQGKLPTVKELATLSSENRQLREAVESGRVQMKALLQKLQKLQSQHSTRTNGDVDHDNVSSSDPQTCRVGVGAKSGILVQPLLNDDDIACLNGLGDSAMSGPAPIFFDARPLAPQKTLTNGSTHQSDKHTHNLSTSHAHTRPSRSPPAPNQPVADIVSGMKLTMPERQCPSCHTVFLMLGEREFQSHVAGCHTTSY